MGADRRAALSAIMIACDVSLLRTIRAVFGLFSGCFRLIFGSSGLPEPNREKRRATISASCCFRPCSISVFWLPIVLLYHAYIRRFRAWPG